MDSLPKKGRKQRGKSWRFWIIFVATPMIVVTCSSLAVYGLYVKKQISGKQGLERGLIYANLNRHTEAIKEFKKQLAKNPEDAKVHYHMGISYFKLKEYDKATAELEAALKTKPDFSDAHIQLAVINLTKALELRKLGKKESLALEKLLEAEDICREITKRTPDYVRAYILLGEIHFAQGFIDDAIIDYKNALELDNSLVDVHVALTRLYIQGGKINLAKEQCNIVLSGIDPDNNQIRILLSAIYEQQGKFDEAITYLRRILEKKPEHIIAHTQLSILYLRTSKYDEALNEADQVFKLSPSAALPPVVYFVKGCVLLQRKDYTNAADMLKKATIRVPKLMQAHYYLALALAESDRVEEAKTEFQSAINIDSGFVPAQLGLARLQARDGRHEETIEICKSILYTEPEDVNAMQIMGMAYIGIQDFKAAEKQFKKILELKPSIGDINMAYLSLVTGQLSKCIHQCEAIIKINQEDTKAYELLGLAHVRRGEFDKGIEQFIKAIEIDQNSINAYLNLAKVYIIKGKNEEAIKALEKLISLDAQNLHARVMLSNLYVKVGNVDEATKTLERVLEINPNYIPGYALASIYMLQGKTGKAMGLFDRALKIDPENAVLYIESAVAYQQDKKYKASILYGQKAVKLKPEIPSFRVVMTNFYTANEKIDKAKEQVKSISTLNDDEKNEYLELIDLCLKDNEKGKQVMLALNKAIVARQKGFFGLAINECKRAAKIFPENLIPKVLLASTYLFSNQNEEAISVYNEIVESKPEFVSSYRGLGKAYLLADKRDEAISIYQDLINMDSKAVSARLTLARLLLKQGSKDKAVKLVGEATKLDPENLRARSLLGEINLVNAKYEEAEKEFSKMIELNNDTFEGYFNMARMEFARGDYDKCIEHCKMGLQIKPTDVRIHNVLGMAHVKKGMLDKAVMEFNKIIDINSDFVPAYLNLAKINLKLNQPGVAEILYKTALQLKPDTVEARLGLGVSYALMGNHTNAIAEFEVVREKHPDNVSIHISLSRSYFALGENNKAQEAVLNALKLEAKSPIANSLLANIYVRSENIPKAINQLKPILLDNPEFTDAYGLGILYMDNGEYDNAISVYKQGIENFPDNAFLWCNLSVAYMMKKGYKSAEDACFKALKIQPNEITPNLCMVNTLIAKGESKNAKRNLQGITKLNKVQKNGYLDLIEFCSLNKEMADKVGYHLNRALAYTNHKWLKRALREYEEITKIAPSNSIAYYAQADILALTGKYEKAVKICEKIIELEPESSAAYNKLAGVHKRTGKAEEAVAQFRKAINIDPDNVTAHLNLGMLLESKHSLKESVEAYKRVIELEPSSSVAYNNLAWLYATKMQDKMEDAQHLAEKAKELTPHNAAVIDTLGMIYYLNGMYDEAVSELEAAVKGSAWNPTIRYHLGMAYYKKGLQRLALTEMERALKISNNFPESIEAKELIEKISSTKGTKEIISTIQ